MKVFYAIYSHSGKPGGHFFSFEHTIYALKEKVEIVVLYIGHVHPVIESLPYRIIHCPEKPSSILGIRKVLKKERPDVIHCFDSISYSYIASLLIGIKCKLVLTIAGGNPLPKKIPYCDDIILFSKETMESFGRCHKFDNSRLHFIPNRVVRSLLNSTTSKKEESHYLFLQVIRIDSSKHNAIASTLELIRMLNKGGKKVKLVLAGTVISQDEKVFIDDFIRINNLCEVISTITDDRVNKGSNLLSMADCIIGTGRSVMEATALGKCVLVPVKNNDFPVLLDCESFDTLFHYNFSGRSTHQFSRENELQKIVKLIADKKYHNMNRAFVERLFSEFFELSNYVVNSYLSIYSKPYHSVSLKSVFDVIFNSTKHYFAVQILHK